MVKILKNSVSDTVLKYIADYFAVDIDQISPATVAYDIEGWDSMSNAEIILGLEEKLGYELEPDELINLNNVGSLIGVFERNTTF